MPCSHCACSERKFDAATAQADLRRFRRHGPDATTRRILALLETVSAPPGATLLDVGGGVGALHHHLLERGYTSAVQVDVSAAYLAAATEEAERRGHAGRVTFRHEEFGPHTTGLPLSDTVTLDRVVCCTPDAQGLLDAAATHARRWVAFSFPRRRWYVRAAVALLNCWRRLRHSDFHFYLHAPEVMAAALADHAFHRRSTGGTWIWAVELFEREARLGGPSFALRESVLESYRRLRFDPLARREWSILPFAAPIWADEHPDDSCMLLVNDRDSKQALTRLVMIRTMLWMEGHLTPEQLELWDAARELLPDWPGFRRLTLTPEERATILELRAEQEAIDAAWQEGADEVTETVDEYGIQHFEARFDLAGEPTPSADPERSPPPRDS